MIMTDAVALIQNMAKNARTALPDLARAPHAQKANALRAAADSVQAGAAAIIAANARDVAAAEKSGMGRAMLDRLMLDEKRVTGIAQGLRDVAALPDPVGKILTEWSRPNGLHFQRVCVPLGVIGVIYESRPNVTADAAAIALAAGNAVILRGGSDSLNSSQAIYAHLQAGLAAAQLHSGAIQLVETRDRAAVGAMLTAHGLIDVIVPRGGKSLVARVQDEARVPVFAHLDGLCHTYIDGAADIDMARRITVNAKLRRTGICGATETVLIDRACVATHAKPVLTALLDLGCEVRTVRELMAIDPRFVAAKPEDWDTEYLDSIVSVAVVEGVGGAIAHINAHGSHHTDCIVTDDADAAAHFLTEVDSAIVLHNASTQFADGGEFGFGAEIGISTGRMHARGPVGVEQLTTYKYVVRGDGAIRGG
jgi:glutamate-5-semialdehyde dehydrogenase